MVSVTPTSRGGADEGGGGLSAARREPLEQCKRLIVVSDLHIGAGPLHDFEEQSEQAFVSALSAWAAEDVQTELVLNGDFLEFVQTEPWQKPELRGQSANGIPLCFTSEQSCAKLYNILRRHGAVMTALSRFLALGHAITIIPGNHDADFFWPEVRATLAEALNATAGLRFVLEQSYRSPAASWLWIEHGHQHDPCNCFYVDGRPLWSEASPPILTDAAGVERLYECIGTRFLSEFLNHIDHRYPFVDNVKPFSRFVRLFLRSSLSRHYGPVPVLVAGWRALGYVATAVGRRPSDLLSSGRFGDTGLAACIAAQFESLRPDEKDILNKALGEGGRRPLDLLDMLETEDRAADALDLLARRFDIVKDWPEPAVGMLGSGGGGMLTLGAAYDVDESAKLVEVAKDLIGKDGVLAVVMGHTHELVDHPSSVNYVNTGCWTRYLDSQSAVHPKELLEPGAERHFPFSFNYAVAESNRAGSLRLLNWRKHGV